jgi:hypothetical protein
MMTGGETTTNKRKKSKPEEERPEGIGRRRNQVMEVTCAQCLPTKHLNFEAKVLGQYTLAYIGESLLYV